MLKELMEQRNKDRSSGEAQCLGDAALCKLLGSEGCVSPLGSLVPPLVWEQEKGRISEQSYGHAGWLLSQRLVPGFWDWGRKSLALCTLEGSGNDPCSVFVQDLLVAALLKFAVKFGGECDLNSVKNSGPPSRADGPPVWFLLSCALCSDSGSRGLINYDSWLLRNKWLSILKSTPRSRWGGYKPCVSGLSSQYLIDWCILSNFKFLNCLEFFCCCVCSLSRVFHCLLMILNPRKTLAWHFYCRELKRGEVRFDGGGQTVSPDGTDTRRKSTVMAKLNLPVTSHRAACKS